MGMSTNGLKYTREHNKYNLVLFHNSLWHKVCRGTPKYVLGDINVSVDGKGQEYLEFMEQKTKTRTGENVRDVRKVTPKMWANAKNISRFQLTFTRSIAFCSDLISASLKIHYI